MNGWVKQNPGFILWVAFLLYLGVTVVNIFYDFQINRFDFFTWFFKIESLLFFFLLTFVFHRFVLINNAFHDQEIQRLDAEKKWQMKEREIEVMRMTARNIQHTVANPLSVIMMMAQSAQRRMQLSDEEKRKWEQCDFAARRISEVMSNLNLHEDFLNPLEKNTTESHETAK